MEVERKDLLQFCFFVLLFLNLLNLSLALYSFKQHEEYGLCGLVAYCCIFSEQQLLG